MTPASAAIVNSALSFVSGRAERRLGAGEDRAGYVRECALIIQLYAGYYRQEVHENHA
jgi:hypothetical protein